MTQIERRASAHESRNSSLISHAYSLTKLLLLLAAMFASIMAAPCLAASIRGEVFLEGPSITVGDLFSDVGDKAPTIVAPGPAPGKKIVYDVTALNKIAALFGIAYTPSGNYDRVSVTRLSEAVTAKDILEMVKGELAANAPGKDYDIALDHAGFEIHRPKGERPDVKLVDFSFDPLKNRFEGALIIGRTTSQESEVVKLTGRAMPMVEVGILSTSVPAGTAIGAGDIEWKKVPQDKAGADAVTDPTRLSSLETRRTLAAGTVLRLRDVRGVRLVTKGALVTITIETPSMQLAAQGRALNDAEYGESVRVLNTQSNRTIDTVVVGTGRVSANVNGINNAQIAAR